MTDKILSALKRAGIETWVLSCIHSESAELFTIKRAEDMRRGTSISEWGVSVYRDFEVDGNKMRGMSGVMIYPDTDENELENKLKQAYENALNVKNPYFDLPDATVEAQEANDGEPIEAILEDMHGALYEGDKGGESFINSSELFVTRTNYRTLTSAGTDVKYEVLSVKGEFVTQCKTPKDVEMYFSFEYSKKDTEALKELSQTALKRVIDRSHADKKPESGTYDVLLLDCHVESLFDILLSKTSANSVYPGYSNYAVGSMLTESKVTGEKINMDVFSSMPYSFDGIPMPQRPLIKDGQVMGIYGETRFCRYLNLPPTGSYDSIILNNGSMKLEDMKKGRVLMPVTFSDFSTNDFAASFGGEIRLAYLFEDGKVTLVSGGSINGNLLKSLNELKFSLERRESLKYSGPRAVLIPNVSVAGD